MPRTWVRVRVRISFRSWVCGKVLRYVSPPYPLPPSSLLVPGDMKESPDISRIVSERHVLRLLSLLADNPGKVRIRVGFRGSGKVDKGHKQIRWGREGCVSLSLTLNPDLKPNPKVHCNPS